MGGGILLAAINRVSADPWSRGYTVCIFPALHRGVRFSVLRVRREEYILPRFAGSDGSCGVEI